MKLPQLRQPPLAKPGEVNYDLFDRFTFAHLCVGIAYGVLHLPFGWVALLAIGWEVIENPLKAYLPFAFPNATADTWRNSVGDSAAVLVGWILLRFFC